MVINVDSANKDKDLSEIVYVSFRYRPVTVNEYFHIRSTGVALLLVIVSK